MTMSVIKNKDSINKFLEKRATVLIITCAVVVLYILFSIIYLVLATPRPFLSYTNELGSNPHPFGYILHNNTAVQEFIFDQDATVHNIELQLANYMSFRQNINQVYIYLNDVMVHEELIDSTVVVDNAFYPLAAMDVHVSEGDSMRTVITSRDGTPSEAITVWIRPDIVSNNRLLRYNMVDGTYEELSGEITMRIFLSERISPLQYFSGRHPGISTVWIFIIFGGIMILTILSFFLMVKNDDGTPSSNQDSQEGT